MTHDELLAKIKNNGTLETELVCTCPHKEVVEIETRPHRNDKALRAVVELHKPIKSPHYGDMVCSCNVSEDYQYPCPTIQAIEKELS